MTSYRLQVQLSTDQNGSDTAYAYPYDDNGNITSITRGSTSITYQYNGANELIRENDSFMNQTVTYTYDVWGNLTAKSVYAYTTATNPGTPAFWEALKQYPFLSDHVRERTFFPLVSNAVYNRLLSHCSRTVMVSDRGWKNELLKTTDCFTCGIQRPLDSRDDDLVSVSTDLSTFLILALWIDKGDMYPLAAEYLDNLTEQIQALTAL